MSVFDIRKSLFLNIKKTKFFLDTNVLLWFFYGNTIYSKNYQEIYPSQISKIIDSNVFVTTTLQINEFFNVVEKTEYKIYMSSHHLTEDSFKLKDYRKLPDERTRLQETLSLILKQMRQIIKIHEHLLSESSLDTYLKNFERFLFDNFDSSLIDFCQLNNIENIITDDIDFAGLDLGVTIFTANNNYFNSPK